MDGERWWARARRAGEEIVDAASPPRGLPNCTGVILAGGAASRYGGRAKGLELVGGRRIIDRVADALRAVADDLLLVANVPDASAWVPGVRCEPDVRPGLGSLGGIYSALAHARTDVLVVAWDMPFVPVPLLAELRHVGGMGGGVAVPASDSRRGVEPLCAYYSLACLAPIARRIDAGDLRVVGFFDDDVHVDRIDASGYGDPSIMFMNVNTPDDLALAERYASTTDGGRRRQEA